MEEFKKRISKLVEQQEIKMIPIVKYGIMKVEHRNDILCFVDKNGNKHACNNWNSLKCGYNTIKG